MKRARFGIALGVAAALASLLVFLGLGGNLATYASPGTLVANGSTYRLTGLVAGTVPKDPAGVAQTEKGLRFTVADKQKANVMVDVLYHGSVADTFRVGREVVVEGRLQNGVFVADRNSLQTLCPSKFKAKNPT
jgi:cytochrome c-type biogenesis protein CcmE